MAARPKLKSIGPTLEQRLEAAIAEEASTRGALEAAEREHAKRYGDGRISQAGLSVVPPSTVRSKAYIVEDAQPEHVRAAEFQQRQRQFLESTQDLAVRRYTFNEAHRRMNRLRLDVAQQVDEKKARAELATLLKNGAGERGRITEIEQQIAAFGDMVIRARAAVGSAEARLTEASAGVDAAMDAGLSDFLRDTAGSPSPEAHGALRAARDMRIAAADELELAKKALSIAEGRLRAQHDALQHARRDLAGLEAEAGQLARQIAATALPGLLLHARAAHAELEGQRVVLSFLSDFAPDAISAEIADYLSSAVFTWGQDGETIEEHPAVAPWLVTIERLAAGDAGAPLPE